MFGPDSGAETRAFHLRDLPLVQRLKTRGISLDSESYLARGLHTVEDAALSRLPLADLGAPTLVARCGAAQAVGQLRHRLSDPRASIVFIAPALTSDGDEKVQGAWLCLLDALARAAGERGAQTLHAEVNENSPVFEVLRRAGHAVYARQDIWRRDPGLWPPAAPALALRPATDADGPAIRALYAHTVPSLVQQANPAPPPDGLVYAPAGQMRGYLGVSEGNRGVYLRLYLDPDAYDEAQAMLDSALAVLPQARKVPVYCCVRSYQDWLGGALERTGFVPWARQTVLVKHLAVQVRQPDFAPLPALNGRIIIPHS